MHNGTDRTKCFLDEDRLHHLWQTVQGLGQATANTRSNRTVPTLGTGSNLVPADRTQSDAPCWEDS